MAENQTPALILRLKRMMDTLSKSERAVCECIIAHPEEVIYLSVAALADNSGVSEPTVVRTCQKLGFTGYQDLKITLIQNIAAPIDNGYEIVTEDDDIQTIVNKVFAGSSAALDLTRDTLNAQDLKHAADAMLNACDIYIFGVGGSSSVVSDMHHKLLRLGLNASAYTDAHLGAIVAAYARENDVVVAISQSGSSKIVVDNTHMAKQNGAKIISITGMGKSPLSKMADIAIFAASSEAKYRIMSLSSRIAELSIIDSMYTYMAFKLGKVSDMRAEKSMGKYKY